MYPKRDNPEIESRIEMISEWIYALSLQKGWSLMAAIDACVEGAKRVSKEAAASKVKK